MQKSANDKHFKSSLSTLQAKTSSYVKEIIAVVGTDINIDKAVKRYANEYFKIDEEFKGESLEEYKEYMKKSLQLFLVINTHADSKESRSMSYHESNNYTLHIKEKYRKIFFDYLVEK